MTPLLYACKNQHDALAKFLIQFSDVNSKDQKGWSVSDISHTFYYMTLNFSLRHSHMLLTMATRTWSSNYLMLGP